MIWWNWFSRAKPSEKNDGGGPRTDIKKIKQQIPIEKVLAYYGEHVEGRGPWRCLFSDRHSNGDRHPSMSTKDGRVTCWSQVCFGDKGADVFEVVNLMEGPLSFPEQIQRVREIGGVGHAQTDRILRRYRWEDPRGQVAYHIRWDGDGPKFTWAQDPDGRRSGRGECRPTLYRLDLVQVADTVILTEGERDADTLNAWLQEAGLAPKTNASTTPNGARDVKPQYFEALLNKRRVYLAGDNDQAGRAYVERLGVLLRASIEDLQVLTVPAGLKDWSDWQAAGGTASKFTAFLDHATPWRSAESEPLENGASDPSGSKDDSWPRMDEAAYHGLVGEFTRAVAPHSEADPVGILLHTLVASGALIGSSPHQRVEHASHPARLNLLVVGKTAGGRKGTAWSTPKFLLSKVDEAWGRTRIKSGLSSGEGLIYQVRDAEYKQVPVREDGKSRGKIEGYEKELEDPGEPDKRLLILESEFASALKVMEREGNILSPVIRDAWDHGNLSPLTKNNRMVATDAHVCLIGHITIEELLRDLRATERANGFANRFLFALVQRAQFLPSGQGVPLAVLESYEVRFRRVVQKAASRGTLTRDPACEALWVNVYSKLEQEVPGLSGMILARAAASVLRLSLCYCLLDEAEAYTDTPAIRVPHLLAALAVWEYCKASVFCIFGDAIGDPVADQLLRAIKTGPQTDTDLYEVLGKRDDGRKGPALDLLLRLNRVHSVNRPTAGRPIREWHAGPQDTCAHCVKRV